MVSRLWFAGVDVGFADCAFKSFEKNVCKCIVEYTGMIEKLCKIRLFELK